MRHAPAAYRGWDKFFFVAYSHRDAETVFADIEWLQGQGHCIAYDEGIQAGSTWADAIADRIQGCERLIFFLSRESVTSEHCRRELAFALEEGKDILAIHLEDCAIPAGLRLSLNNRQAVFRYLHDETSYRAKINESLGPHDQQMVARAASHERLPRRKIDIAVQSKLQSDTTLSPIADGVLRYLSWQGGIYRAVKPSRSTLDDATARYLVDFRLTATDANQLDWQLIRNSSGEILWSGSADMPANERDRRLLYQTIGEGTVKKVSAHELEQCAGLLVNEMDYCQLIIKADQLNYLDPADIVSRQAAIERAVELEPNAGLPHAFYAGLISWQVINGISTQADQDTRKMLDQAKRALRLDGNDPWVLQCIGTAYCRMGDYDSGISLLRRAIKMAPTISVKDQLARSYSFAGKPDEAIELYEEIIASTPDGYAFPHVRLAIAQIQAGRLTDALTNASASTLNYPGDYYGWVVQANILAQLGRMDEARLAIQEAKLLVPNLRIHEVIKHTNKAYGRTAEQRSRLTAGLESLVSA